MSDEALPEIPSNLSDRELIIVTYSEVKGIRDDVKFLKGDQENRIRNLEVWRWFTAGAIAIVSFVLTLYANYHK